MFIEIFFCRLQHLACRIVNCGLFKPSDIVDTIRIRTGRRITISTEFDPDFIALSGNRHNIGRPVLALHKNQIFTRKHTSQSFIHGRKTITTAYSRITGYKQTAFLLFIAEITMICPFYPNQITPAPATDTHPAKLFLSYRNKPFFGCNIDSFFPNTGSTRINTTL